MSTKAVIIWLVLAVVLGIAAIVLLRDPSPVAPAGTVAVGDRLLTFTPGEVEKIIVARPGQPRQIVEKAPGAKSILGADADWQLRIEAPKTGDPELAAWPLESAKLQSLLRVLAELRAVALPARDAQLGQAIRVEILLSGGRGIKLALAERTLAGTGLVEVEAAPGAAKRAVVEDKFHDVFTNPGPTAWRERFPAAGIAPDASRIKAVGSKQAVALAKQGGKWSLREPIAAPADPAAVQRLLAMIQRIGIVDFLDSGSSTQTTGLDKPAATITIEADRRTVEPGKSEPTMTTDTLTLTMGNAADASISKLFAGINHDRVVLVDARSVADVTTDPAALVWPYPVRETSADIGSVAIALDHPLPTSTAAKTLKRMGLRWSQVTGDGTQAPLSAKDQLDAESLVTCLTGGDKPSTTGGAPPSSGPGRPIVSLERPKDYRAIGSITISSLVGGPIDTLEFGAAEKDQVVIRTGSVYRIYTPAQLPGLLQAAWAAGSQPAPTSPP